MRGYGLGILGMRKAPRLRRRGPFWPAIPLAPFVLQWNPRHPTPRTRPRMSRQRYILECLVLLAVLACVPGLHAAAPADGEPDYRGQVRRYVPTPLAGKRPNFVNHIAQTPLRHFCEETAVLARLWQWTGRAEYAEEARQRLDRPAGRVGTPASAGQAVEAGVLLLRLSDHRRLSAAPRGRATRRRSSSGVSAASPARPTSPRKKGRSTRPSPGRRVWHGPRRPCPTCPRPPPGARRPRRSWNQWRQPGRHERRTPPPTTASP